MGDILAAETGWTVYNMGQNGREVPVSAPALPDDTDLLIVGLKPGADCRAAGEVPRRHIPGLKQDPTDCTAANGYGRVGSKHATH